MFREKIKNRFPSFPILLLYMFLFTIFYINIMTLNIAHTDTKHFIIIGLELSFQYGLKTDQYPLD